MRVCPKISLSLRKEPGKVERLLGGAARVTARERVLLERPGARADAIDDIAAEHAVAFHLRFSEPLVRRRFVRERRI